MERSELKKEITNIYTSELTKHLEKVLLEKRKNDGYYLNLGCGYETLDGYINMDVRKFEKVDLVLSLEQRLPFSDNTVNEIVCNHVLEHIDNYLQLMEEIYRICKPKSKIYIRVPYYKYEGAFRDPTHKRFFTENSFDYFSENYKYNYYTTARFKVLQKELSRNYKTPGKKTHWLIKLIPFKSLSNLVLTNLYTEIYFVLEVDK